MTFFPLPKKKYQKCPLPCTTAMCKSSYIKTPLWRSSSIFKFPHFLGCLFLGVLIFWVALIFGYIFNFGVVLNFGVVFIFGVAFIFRLSSFLMSSSFWGDLHFLGHFYFWIQEFFHKTFFCFIIYLAHFLGADCIAQQNKTTSWVLAQLKFT